MCSTVFKILQLDIFNHTNFTSSTYILLNEFSSKCISVQTEFGGQLGKGIIIWTIKMKIILLDTNTCRVKLGLTITSELGPLFSYDHKNIRPNYYFYKIKQSLSNEHHPTTARGCRFKQVQAALAIRGFGIQSQGTCSFTHPKFR